MYLKTRVASYAVCLAVIPLLLACAVVGIQAYQLSEEALQDEVMANLISRRNLKKSEIEGYLKSIQEQVAAQAKSVMLREASREFSDTYDVYLAQLEENAVSYDSSRVQRYYREQFDELYQQRNLKSANVDQIFSQLSPTAVALQDAYIGNNTHPLGEKDKLALPNDGSEYQDMHERYHSTLQDFLQRFGYYDIFIVSPSGNVVYSVYKELDFATSLVSGPYRQSGLAEAYQKAKGLRVGEVYFTQFESYTPSYEAAAAFASSPIYEDGTLVGILIFQMPVDTINQVMTFNGDWDAQDMGESAEVYLVDSSRRILNNRRQFQENKEDFLGLLYDLELNEELITQIDVYDTTAGILPVNSQAVEDALSDGEGFLTFTDYRNIEVMSAFAPLDFAGMNWVILSEVDVKEALEPVAVLRSNMQMNVIIFALGALVLSVGLGIWIARSITNPIQQVSDQVQQVARDLDFREQLPEKGDHELRELAVSVNTLVSGLRENLSSVLEATHKLSSNAEDIKGMTGEIAQAAEQQAQESTMVATAATEMQSTSQEVARNAATTADNTRDSLESAQQAQQLSVNSSEMSEVLSAEMAHVSELLQQVARESESIGAVLDVINGIAEQTNLLALNAAIEAARAGEQGRGFAVVADEVRQLAQRTQSATTEIDQMISSLQGRSQEAVTAMEKDKQITAEFVTGSQHIAESIGHVAELVSSIADMNIQVATAAEEQTSVVDEISHNAENISDVAGLNSERSSRLLSNADQLDQLAKQLQDVVANYQV